MGLSVSMCTLYPRMFSSLRFHFQLKMVRNVHSRLTTLKLGARSSLTFSLQGVRSPYSSQCVSFGTKEENLIKREDILLVIIPFFLVICVV